MGEHQSSKTEYQIRIDGEPKYYPMYIDRQCLDAFAKLCADNPGKYVDIVSIRTEILFNQGTYHQIKKHFAE